MNTNTKKNNYNYQKNSANLRLKHYIEYEDKKTLRKFQKLKKNETRNFKDNECLDQDEFENRLFMKQELIPDPQEHNVEDTTNIEEPLNIVKHDKIVNSSNNNSKKNRFNKQVLLSKKLKKLNMEKKKKIECEIEDRKNMLIEKMKKKKKLFKCLTQKTKRGQPNINVIMSTLVKKIKMNSES